MINLVERRLQDWARWSVMRIDGHYGFGGSQFGYDEPLPGGSRGYVAMPSNALCLLTEEGVAWLRHRNRGMGEAVIVHYRQHPGWAAAMQAQLLGTSVRTFWRRLEAAHEDLLWWYLMRQFGPAPQIEGLRIQRRAHESSPAT